MVAPDHDAPTVFVVYTHDSPRHKADVLAFATLLMNNGVQTELDQWAEGPRQDWYTWALRHIRSSDYTIVVASPQCKVVGDGGAAATENRGSQSELRAIRDLLQDDYDRWLPKLLPVVLPGRDVTEIPLFLQPRAADHYLVELTDAGIEHLLRGIYGEPKNVRPALGRRPVFSQQIPLLPASPPPVAEPSWQVLSDEVDVVWRTNIEALAGSWPSQWPATLEVHLAPVADAGISASQLRDLEQRMPAYAAEREILDASSGVEAPRAKGVVQVSSRRPLHADGGGMAALRTGQRSAWMTLPRAGLASVLSRDDVVRKIRLMLSALADLGPALPGEVVPTAGIDPVDLVRRAGRRAAPPSSLSSVVRLPADEYLTSAELVTMTDQVAAELTERLLDKFPEPPR
ncbi:SEFIR domain-containing protein [Lentzea sp. NPDC003310]|uniref:SEFIR domain-containing protein n=1 Tax=Lentzea sp. NPDC003310 TaxID=3154447 RepID=UPI0033AE99FE